MTDKPLQQRAGRNIGVESLPVFLQAAGAPEIVAVIGSDINNAPGPQVTLLEAVEKALRTPFTRGEDSGYTFNDEPLDGNIVFLDVFFIDSLDNKMLIQRLSCLPGPNVPGGTPFNLSLSGSNDCPFTPAKPLCLFAGEKIVLRAGFILEEAPA